MAPLNFQKIDLENIENDEITEIQATNVTVYTRLTQELEVEPEVDLDF